MVQTVLLSSSLQLVFYAFAVVVLSLHWRLYIVTLDQVELQLHT